LLQAHPEGLSVRHLYRILKSARKPVVEMLNALEQDGQVKKVAPPADGRPGPKPELYVLVE
jgi:hypothetical protein